MTEVADYFRARRRAQGIEEKDFTRNRKFVKRGQELAALMAMPLTPTKKPKREDLCAYESCINPHRHIVQMTERSPHGRGWNIRWFCSDRCKSRYVIEQGRRGW